ncbi:MAG TPA: hypothetical protein VH369_19280, partial [Bryobacteraceae bacterium]
MGRTVMLGVLAVAALAGQKLPDVYHDEVRGDGPYLIEPGWQPLLNGRDLSGWHGLDGAAHEWFTSRGVIWKRVWNPKLLVA